jgi:hypothetical protein
MPVVCLQQTLTREVMCEVSEEELALLVARDPGAIDRAFAKLVPMLADAMLEGVSKTLVGPDDQELFETDF